VKARPFREPGADGRCFVRPGVVENQMDVQCGRHTLFDGVQKLAKLCAAVAAVAFSNDRAGLYVERRKQGCRAVALVVMAAAFGLAGTHRQ